MIGRMSSNQIHQSSLDVILDAQARLARTQEELASGKRILNPSDDPVASAQIQNIKSELTRIETLQKNISHAANELAMVEDSVASIENVLMRARELAVRGVNDSLSAQDRESIATEIDSLREQLIDAANTQSTGGDYIYGGSAVGAPPFTDEGLNAKYNGDPDTRQINIAPGLTVGTRYSGDAVFGKGDAAFVEGVGDSENSGVTSVSAVALIAEQITGDPILVEHTETGITVTNIVTGDNEAVDPESPSVTFEGVTIKLSDLNVPGDSFVIDTSSILDNGLNAFEALEVLSAGLRGSVDQLTSQYDTTYDDQGNGRGLWAYPHQEGVKVTPDNALAKAMEALDINLENVRSVRTDLGVRMNRVDDQQSLNENFNVRLQETLSGLEDLDYTKAITDMNLQMVALEAAQKAYTNTQGLSLFNYL